MFYKRRQYGYITSGSILVTVLLLVGVLISVQDPSGGVVLAILAAGFLSLGLLFLSLTVSIDDSSVELRFGIGLIRRRIPLERIESARAVRNSWWYGLGIRLTPHGWMWNLQGLDAVELTYREGGRFRIGTADPEGLAAAINEACEGPPAP